MHTKLAKKLKIDLKDRKILAILDWNARTTNSEIAKKIMLSKKGVEYRIKRLERLGFIDGYYPIIDFIKLGYKINRMLIQLKHTEEKIKTEIEEYIHKDKDIHWALWFRGRYDFGFDVWARSNSEFKKIFRKFQNKFGKYIKNKTYSTSAGLSHYPYSFLVGEKDPRKITIDETGETAELKDIDKKILKELAKDARQNIIDIARKLKVNYKTISNRIKYLEKTKILLGTRANINAPLLGYRYYKLMLTFDHNIEEAFEKSEKFFKKRIETVYIVDYIGSQDFDVELVVESDNDFFKILEEIQAELKDLLKDHTYFGFTKTIKVTYLPELD